MVNIHASLMSPGGARYPSGGANSSVLRAGNSRVSENTIFNSFYTILKEVGEISQILIFCRVGLGL